MIYHIVSAAVWQQQTPDQSYAHPSLKEEGFIHCTGEQPLLVWVANHYYQNERGDFVILCIDEAALQSPLQWDAVGERQFPHIYGPLNLDAVVEVINFPRSPAGKFLLPEAWVE